MKAWILESQARVEEKPLKLKEVPDPEPRAEEIRIRIHVSGICRTDIHIAEGDLPLRKSPLVLGHQIAGVVDKLGKEAKNFRLGDRVGIAWLNWTCGNCKFCLTERENLCPEAKFTGWNVDGGYAEYVVISEDFAYPLGQNLSFEDITPLMCAGIAGFRALRLTEARKGDKLGLYGFGPTASYVLQTANFLGIESFAITRSEKNKNWARRLRASWVGSAQDELPSKLDAGIVFPPAGNLVEVALSQLVRGGNLVLAPITMTPIEIKDYDNIWMERSIKSLANITRKDGMDFLNLAQEIKIKTEIEVFDFDQIPEVLIAVKQGNVEGSAAIKVA
jgi:propanol-preferring alcohol dehydrogenase